VKDPSPARTATAASPSLNTPAARATAHESGFNLQRGQRNSDRIWPAAQPADGMKMGGSISPAGSPQSTHPSKVRLGA